LSFASDPKIGYYLDKQLNKPLSDKTIFFGEIDPDQTAEKTVYVVNYGDWDIYDLTMIPEDEHFEVVEAPTELPVGEVKKLTIKWIPTKRDYSEEERVLEVKMIVKGKFKKITKS